MSGTRRDTATRSAAQQQHSTDTSHRHALTSPCIMAHTSLSSLSRLDPRWDVNRQYFTKGVDANRIVLKPELRLSAQGIVDQDTIIFKDLGRQISWKTVFHIEYAGPILMHALCFYLPELIYGKPVVHSHTQTVAFWLVVAHYLKREYETHFIHRFSNATMPFFNVFKNSAHYWLLGGLFISYFIYHPDFTATFSDTTVNILAGIMVVSGREETVHLHVRMSSLALTLCYVCLLTSVLSPRRSLPFSLSPADGARQLLLPLPAPQPPRSGHSRAQEPSRLHVRVYLVRELHLRGVRVARLLHHGAVAHLLVLPPRLHRADRAVEHQEAHPAQQGVRKGEGSQDPLPVHLVNHQNREGSRRHQDRDERTEQRRTADEHQPPRRPFSTVPPLAHMASSMGNPTLARLVAKFELATIIHRDEFDERNRWCTSREATERVAFDGNES